MAAVLGAVVLALTLVDCSGGKRPDANPEEAPSIDDQDPVTPGDETDLTISSSQGGRARDRRQAPQPIDVEPLRQRRTIRELVIRDRFVIAYESGVTGVDRKALRDEMGLRLVRRFPSTNSELVVAESPSADGELRDRLAGRPEVRFAEADAVVFATVTPEDERFPTLWGLDNQGQVIGGQTGSPDADVDAPEAWDRTTGSSEVVVAVVDSGVDLQHADLRDNIWTNPTEIAGNGDDDDANGLVDDTTGWDWVDSDADPDDQNGHGTHVAGTIAATGDNQVGIAGVTWHSKIMALRALGADGSGSMSGVAMAFDYAGAAGADVVNASLGSSYPSRSMADVIASHPDTLYVVAAGNDGTDLDATPQYPCSYDLPNLVCVAATDNRDALASYSNHSASSVHLAAPGSFISSTLPPFVTVYSDAFSNGLSADWTTGGTAVWSSGSSSQRAYVGDSPGAPYLPGTDSHLELERVLDLRDKHSCHARFVLRLQTATDADRVVLQVAEEGGAWKNVSTFSGTTEGQWTSGAEDLSSFDGNRIQLRWRLIAQSGESADGIDLDSFSVRCQSAAYTGGEYGYYSGTSMATPHVAGAAALMLSEASLEPSQVEALLRDGVDPLPGLEDAVASGGRLNVDRSLRLAVGAPPAEEAPADGTAPAEEAPEETAAPTPDVARSVTLRLARHLVAKGRVGTTDGYGICRRRVVVKVLRGTKVVARDTTTRYGYFRARVPDRRGRYRAIAVRDATSRADCLRALSPIRRHRH